MLLGPTLLGTGLLALAGLQEARDLGSASVGLSVRVQDLVLPGGELEVVPPTDATPVVVRLEAARPHGEHFRYDLVWYGLEPGSYDLGAFLRRKDGSTEPALPPLALEVRSLLPPGQVEPHRPASGALPALGGYRLGLVGAGVVWVVGWVLLWRVRRRAAPEHARAHAAPPPSPAARLRALVAAAQAGALGPDGRAALELALIAHWKRRLELEALEPAEALARLQQHPEAGPLLAELEAWLHRPDGRALDLEALLAPYARLEDPRPEPAGTP